MLVSLSGREQGKFAFLCGTYEFAAVVNSRPIYKSRKTVPVNYGDIVGKEVLLYFNELALAWVLAVDMGSLNVLGFSFSEEMDILKINTPWSIKSDSGFTLDANVRLEAGMIDIMIAHHLLTLTMC